MSFRRGARLALVAGLAAGGLTLTACTPGSLGSNTATGGSGSAAASVTITYLVDNSDQAVKPATTLVEAFNAANPGITVKLEELEWARWLDLVYTKHDYDMTIVAHVEPRDMRAFATEGNYWNYDNEQFNELLRQADEGTVEDQTTKLKEAARVLAEDAAADWLFLLPNIVIATTDISGIQANQVSMSFDLTTLAARN